MPFSSFRFFCQAETYETVPNFALTHKTLRFPGKKSRFGVQSLLKVSATALR